MLVARLDEGNYQDILNLIKVKSIEEIEIPGIEDFPKDASGRNRRGRDGGKGRGRRDNNRGGGRNRGQRDDGSYHDNSAPTEKVSRKAAPKGKGKPLQAETKRPQRKLKSKQR